MVTKRQIHAYVLVGNALTTFFGVSIINSSFLVGYRDKIEI